MNQAGDSGDGGFDLETFLTAPRVTSLAVSPQGDRLVCGAQHANSAGDAFVGAIYEIGVSGDARPRRLTRSEHGEQQPRFAAGGDLLFVSKRALPEADDDAEPQPWLWRLPGAGGEPEPVARPAAGVVDYATASQRENVAVVTGLHPGAKDWAADATVDAARRERGVTALLVTDFPARHWDRWLGPRARRVFLGGSDADPDGEGWVDVDPDVTTGLELTSVAVAPTGGTVVATRARDDRDITARPFDLVAYEVVGADARARALIADTADHAVPAVSPDGQWIACVRAERSSPDGPGDRTLALVPTAGGPWRDLLPGFDRFPTAPVWTADGAAVLFVADDGGRRLPFRVDVATGRLTRLASEGAFSELCPAPDGRLYALRATMAEPHRVVALDDARPDQEPRVLPSPGDHLCGPGRVERVSAIADDGIEIGAWLVHPPQPADAGRPPPLATFIHGGPVYSWNEWSWRWNPHVLAARGWAVLLPDPALSTGYGLDFVARGWGRWGAEPYTDLMAAVESVARRGDVDTDRTAALGGSFGGYMANWVATQTDRFDALVAHASLWNLETFHGTTDRGTVWEREFGDPYEDPARYRRWSPRRHVARIRTPLLVIHGTRDYRVPEGEALTLWTDLQRHGVEAAYLHFPDENHWVLTPSHARVWYATVAAWLDHHVRGEPWRRPELL